MEDGCAGEEVGDGRIGGEVGFWGEDVGRAQERGSDGVGGGAGLGEGDLWRCWGSGSGFLLPGLGW